MKHQYNDFLNYVETQDQNFIQKLYKNPIFATFMLKPLSTPTTAFVFDLIHKSINISTLNNTKEFMEIFKTLRSLRLLTKRGMNIHLDTQFRASLINGFSQSSDFYFKKCDFQYKQIVSNKLEKILQNIVDPTDLDSKIKPILIHAGLIDYRHNITHKGFEFLLKTHKNQMWLFLIYGIECICATENQKIEYLNGIAELAHKKTQKAYTSTLSRSIIDYFELLGILDRVNSTTIYLNSSFDTLFLDREAVENRFLVIETNRKIYAYTRSKYELAILSLFCTTKFVLDFLVVGELSEENVRKAFEKGITAEQIVDYLSCYSRTLPNSIKELVYIWDRSRKRCTFTDCYLYSDFLNFADFKKVVLFCEQNNCVVDVDTAKRMIMVKVESNQIVKDYIVKNI